MQPLPDILCEACHQYVVVLLSPVSTSSSHVTPTFLLATEIATVFQANSASNLNLANYKLLKKIV